MTKICITNQLVYKFQSDLVEDSLCITQNGRMEELRAKRDQLILAMDTKNMNKKSRNGLIKLFASQWFQHPWSMCKQ